MGHIFISYSRKDADFVRRLHAVLEAQGRETWVDWEGIPPSDKWMTRIHAAIDEAEAFIFVISPDSVVSEVCGNEFEYAIRQHKRVIPILHREPDAPARPELAEINWIFARDSDPFEPACETVISAIDTDLDWVRAHTRLLVRTVEWDRLGRDTSYTLRGSDLDGFEDWAAKAPDKEPKPTVLQSEYLLASRRAVTRRQRITWASIAGGLCIAVALGTVAWFQNRERDRQAEIAAARQLLSRAEALRDIPAKERGAHGRHEDGLRAAARALATLDRLGEATFDADQSVRKSYAQLAKWVDTDLGTRGIQASAFDTNGHFLAFYTNRSELMLMDAESGEIRTTCKRESKTIALTYQLSVSEDGKRLALHTFGGTNVKAWNRLSIWSLPDCEVLLEEELENEQRNAVKGLDLNADGSALLMLTRQGLHRWDIASGEKRRVNGEIRVLSFAASPDGRRYAAYERVRGERTRWIRIRDLKTGQVEREWQVPDRIDGMTWGSAGLLVQSGSHTLYDATGNVVLSRKIAGHQVVLSPDGRYFGALSGDSTIEVREAFSGALVARSVRGAHFKDLAFTPDSRSVVAVSSYQLDVGLWRFDPGGAYSVLEPGGNAARVWFSEDSSELRASNEGRAVWRLPAAGTYAAPVLLDNTLDTDRRPQLPTADRLPVRDGERLVLAEVIGQSGRRALIVAGEITRAGYRRTLEVWEDDKKRAEQPYEPVFDRDREAFLQFAGQDRFLIIGTRTGLEMVDAISLAPVATLYHTGAIIAGAQADGRRAVTMDQNRSVRVWEIASGREIARFTANHPARALALSNDGRWLAALAPGGRVDLWAIAADNMIAQACHWLNDPCP